MLLIVVIVLMFLIVLMVMIIRYYDLYTPIAAMIHPQIKTSPPSGVMGPKMLKGMRTTNDLIHNKYMDPENRTIPRHRSQAAFLSNWFGVF